MKRADEGSIVRVIPLYGVTHSQNNHSAKMHLPRRLKVVPFCSRFISLQSAFFFINCIFTENNHQLNQCLQTSNEKTVLIFKSFESSGIQLPFD